jgi:hypothetical protein
MSNLLTLGRVCLPAILSGLSCRQAAIRFGVSASSAIPCRTMERLQGDAKPKAVVARPALDAPGPSCGRPFARWSMRPGTSRSKSSGRRWPRDASGKLRRAVALLSPPQDHAQKRPRMARAGSPGHREAPRAWFNGQLESRSRPPCVQHRNARPRPTPAAGTDGCRNGQRLRVGVPYVHSKTTTFVAGLHLNEIVAPVVLDGSTNGSAFERPSADTDLSISSRRNLFGVLG